MTETKPTSQLDDSPMSYDLGTQQGARGGRPVAKDARAVANYFLARAEEQGKSITPMQLIKLVYFAHGWHLAWCDKPLIGDDVEAWRHGPVIPSVYHAFKKYGREPIERPTYGEYDLVIDIGLLDTDDKVINPKPICYDFPDKTRDVMDEIFRTYGVLSGIQLSRMTHIPGSPWEKAYQENKNEIIDEACIKAHFEDLDRENSKYLEQQGS